ncbi:MAG: 2OG-Fe(II) oxygenase family protein [Actinomycetota bacterium]
MTEPAPRTSVPIIDLTGASAEHPPAPVVDGIGTAAAELGFFQVVGHGIPDRLIAEVWAMTRAFFALPAATKRSLQRTRENSRGYYDRELTKNRRDRKEVLDIAQVPFPEAGDDDPRNHQPVDGRNQWPDLPGFRDTMVAYLAACESLSLDLLAAFSVGLGERPDRLREHFGPGHSSFVRLNHYPLDDPLTAAESAAVTPLGDMALHHHSDAGALTVLLQDEVGGLQVMDGDRWIDVPPIPGALVINTGDMMQVWSNDRYRAALHRVRPITDRARLSLPYFFNPSYGTDYAPLPGSIATGDVAHYRSINWGDFRQARADGDYADYGAEIQISDFRTVGG